MIDEPVAVYVPPQEPEYQYQFPLLPWLPPLAAKVVGDPAQEFVWVTEIETGGTKEEGVIKVTVVLIQVENPQLSV